MNEVRIIFSPQTAEPAFICEVAAAMLTAQRSVAAAVWNAQLQVLQAMLAAQFAFLDRVSWAASRTR